MLSSKLLETIQSFNTEELLRLELFLQSPFFNSGPDVERIIQLFQHLKCVLLEKEESSKEELLDKKHIYSIIYPKKKVVKGKLEKLMSSLLNLTKQFIIQEYSTVKSEEQEQLLILSKFYREKKLFKQFNLNIQRLESLQAKVINQDEYFLEHQYKIQKEIFEHKSIYNNRKSDVNLKMTLQKYEMWSLASKLWFLYELHYQKIHTPLNLSDIDIKPEDIENILLKNPNWNTPIIKIYYKAFTLLYSYPEDNLSALNELKDLLTKYRNNFSNEIINNFRTLIRTYTIKQYNEGKFEYLDVVFRTYQEHLEAGFLYYQGKIHISTFYNIVMFGLKLNETDWVEKFIKNHSDRLLGSKNPDVFLSFNLALLHFTRKEYDEAIQLLNFESEDIHLKIGAKRLEIKIYFEQESLLLDARLEAFKIYVFRIAKQYLTIKTKMANNNFVDILKQIIHPKTYNNPDRIQKIRSKISKAKILADREWLLDLLSR